MMINKKILYLYVVVTYDNITNCLLPLKHIFKHVDGYDYLKMENEKGRKAVNKEIIEIIKNGNYDYMLIHPYQNQIHVGTLDEIKNLGVITLSWNSDDQWRYDYFKSLADHLSHPITVCELAFEKYKEAGNKPIQSTWAANEEFYCNFNEVKDLDITFVGQNYGDRIDNVVKFNAKPFGRGFGSYVTVKELVDIVNHSKISLNFTSSSPPNQHIKQAKPRVFEVPMCGGFLLTERFPCIDKHFVDGKEIVIFDTIDEGIEKAKYYLKHEKERNKIAKAGHERALRDHTWTKRLYNIFKDVEEYYK